MSLHRGDLRGTGTTIARSLSPARPSCGQGCASADRCRRVTGRTTGGEVVQRLSALTVPEQMGPWPWPAHVVASGFTEGNEAREACPCPGGHRSQDGEELGRGRRDATGGLSPTRPSAVPGEAMPDLPRRLPVGQQPAPHPQAGVPAEEGPPSPICSTSLRIMLALAGAGPRLPRRPEPSYLRAVSIRCHRRIICGENNAPNCPSNRRPGAT